MRNIMSSETTAVTKSLLAVLGDFVLETNEGEHSLLLRSPVDEILGEDHVILCFLPTAFS